MMIEWDDIKTITRVAQRLQQYAGTFSGHQRDALLVQAQILFDLAARFDPDEEETA